MVLSRWNEARSRGCKVALPGEWRQEQLALQLQLLTGKAILREIVGQSLASFLPEEIP